MKTIRTLIVDDERLARQKVRTLLDDGLRPGGQTPNQCLNIRAISM